VNFRLNRLALYAGPLAACDRSAVSLPSGERVTDADEPVHLEHRPDIRSIVHEVDGTVLRAGLLPHLAGALDFDGNIVVADGRRTLLSSECAAVSAFLKNYEVLGTCRFSAAALNLTLKKVHAGRALLRFSVDPSSYWDVRKKIEAGLPGEGTSVHVFKVDERAVLAAPAVSRFRT
jgi:hypothetical protein